MKHRGQFTLKTEEQKYFDKCCIILNHYQFPNIFLRQTKNTYLSILDDDILGIAKKISNKELCYNSLKKGLQSKITLA